MVGLESAFFFPKKIVCTSCFDLVKWEALLGEFFFFVYNITQLCNGIKSLDLYHSICFNFFTTVGNWQQATH